MEIPTVTISYEATCPYTDKTFKRELSPADMRFHILQSVFSDCDDGIEFFDDFTCPVCNHRHEITLFKDRPFGC